MSIMIVQEAGEVAWAEPSLSLRLPISLIRCFDGAKSFQHAASQIGCEVHPRVIEGVEVLREALAGMPGAVERLEYAEHTGKGDPKASGPSTSAAIVHDHHGSDPERQRDRLSLSGI